MHTHIYSMYTVNTVQDLYADTDTHKELSHTYAFMQRTGRSISNPGIQ